jgi:hypothetical protein
VAAPTCITHRPGENGVGGEGAHTSPTAQVPMGVDVGAQARATCPHAGGVVVATPPVVEHVPPAATGAATVTLSAAMDVGSQLEVTVCVPITGGEQELSKKKDMTGPSHDSPLMAPHPHAEHVAAGAVSMALPSNAGVASKPEPHGGGAPCPAVPT